MKRLLCLLIIATVCLSLCACLRQEATVEAPPAQTQAASSPVYEEQSSILEPTISSENNALGCVFSGESSDPLTLEKIYIRPEMVNVRLGSSEEAIDGFRWQLYFRNTSGKELERVGIWYRYLDKDKNTLWGDCLESYRVPYNLVIISDDAYKFSFQSLPNNWEKEIYETAVYLEFYAYAVNSYSPIPFTQPILIYIDDYIG